MEATQWLPGRWGVVAWQRSGFMRNRTAFIGNDTSGAGSAGRGRASVRPPIRAGESAGSSGEDGVTAAVAVAGGEAQTWCVEVDRCERHARAPWSSGAGALGRASHVAVGGRDGAVEARRAPQGELQHEARAPRRATRLLPGSGGRDAPARFVAGRVEQIAAVLDRDPLGDGEPQAGAVGLGGGVGLEEARLELRGDTRPVVLDGQLDGVALRAVRDLAPDAGIGSSLQGVLGVLDEVREDLHELVAVRAEGGAGARVEVDGDALALVQLDDGAGRLEDVEGHRARRGQALVAGELRHDVVDA